MFDTSTLLEQIYRGEKVPPRKVFSIDRGAKS